MQRLNWQKIWSHSPPEKDLKVRGIAWRFDEKVIAIGKDLISLIYFIFINILFI